MSRSTLGRQRSLDCSLPLYYLPDDKIVDWSKLKGFADNKIDVNGILKFGLGRVENIVGKGENAGYQHFLLFPKMFSKAFSFRSFKVGIVW